MNGLGRMAGAPAGSGHSLKLAAHDTSARQKTRARCRLKGIPGKRKLRISAGRDIAELGVLASLLHCNEIFWQFFASKS
jgi:hypothetical protein